MKKLWTHIVVAVLISIGWTASSQGMELIPVTSFDDTWVTENWGTGSGTVTTDGSKVNLSVQGTSTDFGEMFFYKNGTSGIIGMIATLRVDQATTIPYYGCQINILQYVGKMGNSKIQLLMSLEFGLNQERIGYRVAATDLTTNVKTVLYFGNIGSYDGNWAFGDSKTVAFARVGSEFWFYVQGSPGIVKIQAFEEITPFDGPPAVDAWAGPGNSISGSVSDIYLIKE